MAKLLDQNLTYVSFPINKYEEDKDGNLIVEGVVTDGTVDSDRQVVDPAWSGKALEAWMASGPNVRVMHSPALYPAGRGLHVELGDSTHTLKALVVEDTAKKLVRNKVLRAYSVGIANPVIKRDPTGKAPGGIVVGGELAEVSLVDRPANKNCQLTLAKSADSATPWTYGDLDDLLAKAEKEAEPDLTKTPEGDAGDGLVDPQEPGHPDDDSAPSSDADVDPDDAAVKAYTAAVALYKGSEPSRDGVPLSGTEYLRKAADWQRWAAEGEDEGLDGTPSGYLKWTAKRDMDPNVGGGVDRDKIPAADFVDSTGRRFPIVKPGDVSDAVSSFGRANPAIPMATFKSRLKEIAARKGAEFVAALPDSWKAVEADLSKDVTLTSPDPDGLVPYNLATGNPPAVKGGGRDCINCGKTYHSDSTIRRCENCGKKLPKGDMDTVDKAAGRLVPDGVAEAGPHREPDGDAVEALEHDAGMHVDPDAEHDHTPASLKGGGEAYVVKRTHDALCAAYGWADVVDEYPALKSVGDVCETTWWTDQIPAALAKGDLTGVAFLAGVAQSAGELQFHPAALLDDARATVRKMFTDAHPMTSPHPGGTITPGQFQRPYLTDGRASQNAAARGPAHQPPAPHGITADDFNRPLITAGHEAASPSDRGDNNPTSSTASGSGRALYAAAAKAASETAMKAMHDHLAGTFPDMCPMAPSAAVMPPQMHANATPTPTVMPTPLSSPGEKSEIAELVKAAKKAAKRAERAAAELSTEAILKGASTTSVADLEATIEALKAQVDELGAQPDPAQAPLRGVIGKAANPTGAAPVEKRSLIAEARDAAAAAEATEYIGFLQKMANSANPAQREAAEDALAKLLTQQHPS